MIRQDVHKSRTNFKVSDVVYLFSSVEQHITFKAIVMGIDSLKDHGTLTKREIVKLLWDVLSDQLSDQQKENKVDNILRKLRLEQKIETIHKGINLYGRS